MSSIAPFPPVQFRTSERSPDTVPTEPAPGYNAGPVSRRSLMPEGVANALARDEIRDLLAYLQTLR
jgi:hypothetical protein